MSDAHQYLKEVDVTLEHRRIASPKGADFFDWVDRRQALEEVGRLTRQELPLEVQEQIRSLANFALKGINSSERFLHSGDQPRTDHEAVARGNSEAIQNLIGALLANPEILDAARVARDGLEARAPGAVTA